MQVEPKQYPSWRFHPTRPGVIVADAEEDKALMDQHKGWRETPYSAAEVAKITGQGAVTPASAAECIPPPEARAEDWKPPVLPDVKADVDVKLDVDVETDVDIRRDEDEEADEPKHGAKSAKKKGK